MYVPSFKYVNILLYSVESISHLFLWRQFHLSACVYKCLVNTRQINKNQAKTHWTSFLCRDRNRHHSMEISMQRHIIGQYKIKYKKMSSTDSTKTPGMN